METEKILKWHNEHAWQPFTQMKLAGDPLIVERAQGVYLYTNDGRAIIDAIGSWWVNIHGHARAELVEAAASQLGKLEHVMYAAFTHEPAVLLSRKLAGLTGMALPRVFFSDNGSTAVEVALKMAFQYFHNQGRKGKTEILTLAGGYHGDTAGTMSVGGRLEFHKLYEPFLFPVTTIPCPQISYKDLQNPECHPELYRNALAQAGEIIAARHERSAALILEPILQGAAGMVMHAPYFLRELRKLCTEFDILLIADEVFTGFGRTGSMFACEKAGIWPDLLCLSKALTGGFFPLAATLATEQIYQAFYSDNRMHTFFHGHSMTANPVGCAIALRSLELLEKMDTTLKNLELGHREGLLRVEEALADHIVETRQCGTVAAVELREQHAYSGDFAPRMIQASLGRGVSLRPLGNVVYLTPPYIINPGELERVYDVLVDSIREVIQEK
ncbi:MAG: adenosylmethionine--8-amino-7-oxononanoate transaminase [Spirochaetales bacterium]|nr:adenosylmethionine--8-amino-7-oxononanoate transaminase [Spirochaetales bacterium]